MARARGGSPGVRRLALIASEQPEHRVGEPFHPSSVERARRKLHDERGRPGETVVLPAGSAPRVAGETRDGHPGEPGIPPFDGGAAPGKVDDVLMLVEPDGHVGSDPEDQRRSDASLRLGERPWTRVVEVAWVSDRLPPP